MKSSISDQLRSRAVKIKDAPAVLEGVANGKTALVVSAGPSAVNWQKVYNQISSSAPIVVCIKQAVEIPGLGEICDIHFFNAYNIKKYHYRSNPFRILSGGVSAPPVYCDHDLYFSVERPRDSLTSSLAGTKRFQDHSMDITGENRPWGPGIMHELVIYALVHMGVKSIHTVGWDIADSNGTSRHFDEKGAGTGPVQKSQMLGLRKLWNNLGLNILKNYYYYKRGLPYNRTYLIPGEAETVADSIPALRSWLDSKGVEICINSNSRWMNK